MKNQISFRLTTTLLPTDTSTSTKRVTTVINKVDENGNKYYPTFTEETVVITNDDRTVMETTRAVADGQGNITFVARGLDDQSQEELSNRKLTWNPGSLCFVTAGASDMVDPQDDIVWTGKQTYTGDMESRGKATYRGELITEKGVQYPTFDSVAELEADTNVFPGKFAVVNSTGELYRYNAVTQEWSVVTTNEPTNPEMASETTIGTVRIATQSEFDNGTDTGSQGEKLVATPSQIQGTTPSMDLHVINIYQEVTIEPGQTKSITYPISKPGFITIWWNKLYYNDYGNHYAQGNQLSISGTAVQMTGINLTSSSGFSVRETYAVSPGEITITGSYRSGYSGSDGFAVELEKYFYFG